MKLLKIKLQRLTVMQISILLIIAGLFFGILFANLFQPYYYEKMVNYHDHIFSDIVRENIDYSGLFIYILSKNLREFVVFWLLCITILGIPYMIFKLFIFGFTAGFLISSIAIQFGIKGILLILAYIFPHGLVYIPVIILCLYNGYRLTRTIYYENAGHIGIIIKQLKSYVFLLIFLTVLILLGSFLEAYVGSFFLKKILVLFT